MKTKLSKRILSVFLSVLMVVVSIPFASVTALADEKSDLETAITAYTDKMAAIKNGKVYTNMLNAYNAYMAAIKALDAYNYGTGAASSLTTAKNNLVSATSAMTEFTAYKGTAKGYHYNSEAVGGYDNLLYCSKNTQVGSNYVTTGNCNAKVFLPYVAVMLYDGTDTGYPTVAEVVSVRSWGSYQTYILDSIYLSNPETLTLKHNWYGYTSGTGNTYMSWPNKTSSSYDIAYTTGGDSNYQTSNSTTRFYNNEVYYNGTSNTTTFYDQMVRATFTVKINDTKKGNMTVNNESTSSFVVNYKPIADFVTNTTRKTQLSEVINYKEGGLTALMKAMDACTSFNPNSYFTNTSDSSASTDVQSCASKISEIVALTKGLSPETDVYYDYGYQELRDAMDAEGVRATFAGTNVKDDGSLKYTEESWNNFSKMFIACQKFMTNIPSAGYTSTNEQLAAIYASDLATYYSQLDLLFTPVKTTALEAVIDQFEAYELVFTSETYSVVADAVKAAKEAVWGSVDKYKSSGDALESNTENKAIVSQHVTNIKNAFKQLKFSPDAVVTTEYGNYSLNAAIDMKNNISDPLDYGNYSTYSAALTTAENYKSGLSSVEFYDYDAQLDEYTTAVTEILTAYYGLEYSFTKIPDGTLAGTAGRGAIEMYDTHAGNGRYWNIKFGYPSAGAVILRTKHTALDVTYGQATLDFGTTSGRTNNMIDSITLDATANDTYEINSASGTITSNPWPPALSDNQKATYAGNLSVDGTLNSKFSLKNFAVSGVNQYYNLDWYARTADGTVLNTFTSSTDEYTKLLGTSDGLTGRPINGGLYAQSHTNGDQYGTISTVADMVISVPATTKETLSAATVPTSTSYELNGKYFGALYTWDVSDTLNYAGYGFMKSDDPLSSTVTVVDISYLCDLVDECNILLDTSLIDYSQMYTADSWATFTDALSAAQAPINYTGSSAATILSRCKTRYNELWAAYKALTVKEVPVTFTYKDANGADQSTTINVEWGKQIGKNYGEGKNYADQFNAIVPATYKSADGLYTYTFTGNWSPAFSASSPVKAEATYTAEYDQTMNPADFTAYNASVAQLLGTINTVDPTYTVADLQAVKAAVEGMTYFAMSDDDKALLKGDVQTAINAEQAQIDSLRTGLTPSTIDANSARATVEAQKALQDVDAYDLSSLEFEYTTPVTIGSVTAQGLKFSSQEALDAAVKDALNNLNKHQYTVSFNGTELGTVEYGTPVVISSDGVMTTDVADLTSDAYDGSKLLAWSYSYAAPSRDGAATAPKYMLTGRSLGFVVKGDTYITTANATSDESGYAVKFMTNDGKVFDVQYTTDGTVTMPTAPSYAYYTFTGYDNGLAAGDTLNVSANTTVVANYTPNVENSFQINFYNSKAMWDTVNPESTDTYTYGQRVELTAKNAYCWATVRYTDEKDLHEYTLLSYGPSYSFNASRAYTDDAANGIYDGIVALTEAEYKLILDGDRGHSVMYDGAGNVIQSSVIDFVTVYPEAKPTVSVLDSAIPVYDASNNLQKISMVGTFAIPDGYKIVEAGILFSSNQSADMKVENVGTDGIKRFKASSYTSGNQFTINVKTPESAALYQYKGYATVMNADGKLVTVYSKAICGNVADYR